MSMDALAAAERFESLGFGSFGMQGRKPYFATRSAPRGAVSADVVAATFYKPMLVVNGADDVHVANTTPWSSKDRRDTEVCWLQRTLETLDEKANS